MVTDLITEVIFVGLPGPTHHYGGLSEDNIASSANRGSVSNPKLAALQVLDLLGTLRNLGVTAAVLPPQLRPNFALLRQHFSGSEKEILEQAAIAAPALLEKASSASAMWVANATTVCSGVDSADKKLHITTANLFTHLHRRIEADDTHRALSEIFHEASEVALHAPLSPIMGMKDEGAANHMRLSPGHAAKGLHVFVYGTEELARQSLPASQALAHQHQLPESQLLFLRQNPEIVREGVFHNDVIAVSNEQVLLVHERAYAGGRDDLMCIRDAYRQLHPGMEPQMIIVRDEELSVEEAVRTYFFNSQIVTKPGGGMAIIAPAEVELLYEGKALALMQRICEDDGNPIDEIEIVDLRQSMRNGGGPACLRLRVPMDMSQLAALARHTGVVADEALIAGLRRIINRHYPDALTAQDLSNIGLYHRSQAVMADLEELLKISLLP